MKIQFILASLLVVGGGTLEGSDGDAIAGVDFDGADFDGADFDGGGG